MGGERVQLHGDAAGGDIEEPVGLRHQGEGGGGLAVLVYVGVLRMCCCIPEVKQEPSPLPLPPAHTSTQGTDRIFDLKTRATNAIRLNVEQYPTPKFETTSLH